MTTLNQNFFQAFDAQLEAKSEIILDLERKIAELQNELKDAKVLKQQYLSVDAIAKSSLEQLKNAIESINYAYHTIGTTEMGEAFVIEFEKNVLSEMNHLRESPTISDIPLLPPEQIMPTPSDNIMDEVNFLLEEAEIETTDPLSTVKGILGSSTNDTLEAITTFYKETKINALRTTIAHKMPLAELKQKASSIKGVELIYLPGIIKKKFGLTNKVGFLLYVLSPDWYI